MHPTSSREDRLIEDYYRFRRQLQEVTLAACALYTPIINHWKETNHAHSSFDLALEHFEQQLNHIALISPLTRTQASSETNDGYGILASQKAPAAQTIARNNGDATIIQYIHQPDARNKAAALEVVRRELYKGYYFQLLEDLCDIRGEAFVASKESILLEQAEDMEKILGVVHTITDEINLPLRFKYRLIKENMAKIDGNESGVGLGMA